MSNDVVLEDPNVSRFHAELRRVGDRIAVRDPTFVCGKQPSKRGGHTEHLSRLLAEMQEKFKPVIAKTMPNFPGGDWTAAVTDGWYRNVAPNVDRNG